MQIKKLTNEVETDVDVRIMENNPKPSLSSTSKLFHGIRKGISQMGVMLEAPYLKNACVAYTIQFCILFG